MKQIKFCIAALVLLAGFGFVRAQETQVYQLNQKAQWGNWKIPPGTIQFNPDGSFTPVKFETNINAALSAERFTHKLAGNKDTQGGIWRVGSTAAGSRIRAENIMDGDPQTYWKPDPNADLKDWWIELDLGRVVPVTKLRLIFPDTTGARPLREFRIMGSDGERRSFQHDLFFYEIIGGTTRYNDQNDIEYQLAPIPDIGTQVLFENLEEPQTFATTYRTLQYIRVRIDSKTEDAALAELEAHTFGYNVAPGSLERGGSILDKTGRGTDLIDGDFNTSWSVHGNAEDPTIWILDLGAFVWVDRILQLGAQTTGQDTKGSSFSRVNDHRLLSSDGSLTLTGNLDFELLHDDNDKSSKTDFQYIMGRPQAIRYLAAIYAGANGNMAELMIIPTGHAAGVELESDFIDLGNFSGDNRAKRIQGIFWDADLPADTRIEVSTRTGHQLTEKVDYFKLDGSPLAGKAEYEATNKYLRGETDTLIVAGNDWSAWSSPYSDRDQFLSPNPRRYLQIKLILSSDRPEVAPTLRSLGVDFTDAVIREVEGTISPRVATPGVPHTFTYKLWGDFAEPTTFDRLLFETPSRVNLDSLEVRVGGNLIEPSWVNSTADSLVIHLPEPVAQAQDTVAVQLRAQIDQNPTLFNAFVAQSARPELWQQVTQPKDVPRAMAVFFPVVPRDLLSNLSVQPHIATPNGDGIGDWAEIRFQVFNVDSKPEVGIYSLDGQLVRQISGSRGADGFHLYTWSGKDRSGHLATPGLYLCRVRLETQAKEQQLTKTIGLAY